jgi:hypothetical protein
METVAKANGQIQKKKFINPFKYKIGSITPPELLYWTDLKKSLKLRALEIHAKTLISSDLKFQNLKEVDHFLGHLEHIYKCKMKKRMFGVYMGTYWYEWTRAKKGWEFNIRFNQFTENHQIGIKSMHLRHSHDPLEHSQDQRPNREKAGWEESFDGNWNNILSKDSYNNWEEDSSWTKQNNEKSEDLPVEVQELLKKASDRWDETAKRRDTKKEVFKRQKINDENIDHFNGFAKNERISTKRESLVFTNDQVSSKPENKISINGDFQINEHKVSKNILELWKTALKDKMKSQNCDGMDESKVDSSILQFQNEIDELALETNTTKMPEIQKLFKKEEVKQRILRIKFYTQILESSSDPEARGKIWVKDSDNQAHDGPILLKKLSLKNITERKYVIIFGQVSIYNELEIVALSIINKLVPDLLFNMILQFESVYFQPKVYFLDSSRELCSTLHIIKQIRPSVKVYCPTSFAVKAIEELWEPYKSRPESIANDIIREFLAFLCEENNWSGWDSWIERLQNRYSTITDTSQDIALLLNELVYIIHHWIHVPSKEWYLSLSFDHTKATEKLKEFAKELEEFKHSIGEEELKKIFSESKKLWSVNEVCQTLQQWTSFSNQTSQKKWNSRRLWRGNLPNRALNAHV